MGILALYYVKLFQSRTIITDSVFLSHVVAILGSTTWVAANIRKTVFVVCWVRTKTATQFLVLCGAFPPHTNLSKIPHSVGLSTVRWIVYSRPSPIHSFTLSFVGSLTYNFGSSAILISIREVMDINFGSGTEYANRVYVVLLTASPGVAD
jgi:hypothetical protein